MYRHALRSTGLLSVLAMTLLLANGAAAQTNSATLRGRIIDSAGVALPGSAVAIVATRTGAIAQKDGSLTVRTAPGTYSVRISSLNCSRTAVSG